MRFYLEALAEEEDGDVEERRWKQLERGGAITDRHKMARWGP